jgi:mono/diheme cytochrome c family protein
MWKILLFAILMAGCAGQGDKQPLPSAMAPTITQPRQFTEGEALYLRHCSGCHGWEGRGDGAVAKILGVHPPSLRRLQLYKWYDEAELTAKILFGDAFLIIPNPDRIVSTEADILALFTHIKRLPQIEWDEVMKGKETYDSLCAYCHGFYGRGDGIWAQDQAVPPRDLRSSAFQTKMSDRDLVRIISQGKGSMPGSKDVLEAEEVQSIIAYLRILSPGFELYERFCAACHGSDGYPLSASEELFGVPSPPSQYIPIFNEDFFRSRTDATLRLWVRHMYKAKHSSMPHFSFELNGGNIRKIIGYLRRLPPES